MLGPSAAGPTPLAGQAWEASGQGTGTQATVPRRLRRRPETFFGSVATKPAIDTGRTGRLGSDNSCEPELPESESNAGQDGQR
jgi:hypothetical protein